MKSRNSVVPNLVLAQRVVDKMLLAAQSFLEDETGEAMVGLLLDGDHAGGVPTIYILDTITPDPELESTVRELYTFQQGDDFQDEVILWLQLNWGVTREQKRLLSGKALQPKWNVPLRYLGDWHKQPGLMIQPSGGDLQTALDWLGDPSNKADFLLVPIVTLGHEATTIEEDAAVNYLSVPLGDGTTMRVDWWFVDRQVRAFRPMTPALYPNDQLPELAPYPWHLLHYSRMKTEMAQLEGDGWFTGLVNWDADGKQPLEICCLVGRVGSDKLLVIVTDWDYPARPPYAYVMPWATLAPNEGLYDLLKRTWSSAKPVKNPPGWKWTPDTYLIDYVHALETALGLRPAAATAGIGGGASENDLPPVGKPPEETEIIPQSKVAEALARLEKDTGSADDDDDEEQG